jgi:hypothetical protein
MVDPKLFVMLAVGTLLLLNGILAGGFSLRQPDGDKAEDQGTEKA